MAFVCIITNHKTFGSTYPSYEGIYEGHLMSKNSKKTSSSVAKLAAKILKDPDASGIQKSLAGSVLSQSGTSKQTGADMEAKASSALKNPNSAAATQTLAASVVSQSNNDR